MRELRERGIYKTPDGRQYVACAALMGHYLLFGLSHGLDGFPTYAVDASGQLVAATQPTRWRATDLIDTGQTLREIFATSRIAGAQTLATCALSD